MSLPQGLVSTSSAGAAARRQLQRRRLAVALAAVPALAVVAAVSMDLGYAVIAAAIAASGVDAAWSLRSQRASATSGLALDVVVLALAVIIIRPPAGSIIGPAVYAALASLVFIQGRAARVTALCASVGVGLVLAVANLIAPRVWDPAVGFAIVVGSLAISTTSVAWLLRNLGAIVAEQERHESHLERLVDHHTHVAERLSLVLDTTAEGIYGVDADGTITFASQRFGEILGMPPEEAVGRNAHDVIHRIRPDGSPYPAEECEIRQADISAGLVDYSDVYTTADGGFVPVTLNARPMVDASGAILGSIVSFRNVAQELETRRRLDFQASLLDQIEASVITVDMNGRVISWNRQAEVMYGWTAAEAEGRDAVELTVAGESKASLAEVADALATSGSWRGDMVAVRRDGTTFPVVASSVFMRDDSGEPVGIASVSTDASDLRAIEAEARRQGTLASGVLEAVPFPVAVIADDGEILVVNRAWTGFAKRNGGAPDATGVGVNYIDVARSAVGDADAVAAAAGLSEILTGVRASLELEYPCHAPDEERWFRMIAVPLPGIGAVVAHVDVTVEHRARSALENVIVAKDRFIASVSHELRTPLTAVLGLAEELRDGHIPSEEVGDFHHLVADQARDLSYLVEDLLVAARLDGDAIRTDLGAVSLADEVAAVIAPLPREQVSLLRVDLTSLKAEVVGDSMRLRQVVRNLVVNAVRHGAPPVDIDLEVRGDEALLTVTDRGDGVPPHIVENLFDPYVNGGGAGTGTESIGLGLFVSNRLVDLMGGRLTYRRDGDRTVFTIALPLVATEPARAAH